MLTLLPILFWISLGAALYRWVLTPMLDQSEPAFVDDLPWGDLLSTPREAACLELRDGGLLTAYALTPPDASSLAAEAATALAEQLNRAFQGFGDGWMLHLDALRHPSPRYPATQPAAPAVVQRIDEERRRRYEADTYFETTHILTVTYVPPKTVDGRLRRFAVTGAEAETDAEAARDEAFAQRLQELEALLPPGLHLRRLTSDELMTHLHTCVSGRRHQVRTPPGGADVATALAVDYVDGFHPEVDGRRLVVLEVVGFPQTARDLGLELDALGVDYRASHRVLFLDHASALRYIDKVRHDWYRKRRPLGAFVREMFLNDAVKYSLRYQQDEVLFEDGSARHMIEDAGAAYAAVSSGAAAAVQYTCVVLLWGDTLHEARTKAERVQAVYREHGFRVQVARFNSAPAYLGSLPGNGYENVRRPVVLTTDLAYFLPMSTAWAGADRNPSALFPPNTPALVYAATGERTPFRLNLHVGDVGHTLVCGATGTGKSVLVGALTAQWLARYARARCVLFDLGSSARLLCELAGGRHVALDPDHVLPVQPGRFIDQEGERAWFVDWLETLLHLTGMNLTADDRLELTRRVQDLAGEAPDDRTLRTLELHVQRQTLRQAFETARESGLGPLFYTAAERLEPDAATPLQVIEMSGLRRLSDRVYLPVLLVLLHRIEQALDGTRPTLIVIEEAWHALAHPVFAARIEQWLYTLRKKNTAVVLVAQSVEQVVTVPSATALLSQVPTRILLPDPMARSGRVRTHYEALGLSEAAIDQIARARPKREYFYTSPRGHRLFALDLGPTALAALTPPRGWSQDAVLRLVDRLKTGPGAPAPSQGSNPGPAPAWLDPYFTQVQGPAAPVPHPASETPTPAL